MKNKRVIIIEDNDKNLKLEQDLLEVGGFEVLSSPNAEDGIKLIEKEQPDVVIMDYHLPGMDGVAAIGVLKKQERTKDIPIVIVTASATSADLGKLRDSGAEDVIVKPINTREFANKIGGYIRVQ